MQVILLEKVPRLGGLGTVVKVKDGFARNFLIPQGKAKRATEANLAQVAAQRAELELKQHQLLQAAQARGEKLAGKAVKIAQKAGVDGRLFGSISGADIAAATQRSLGIEISKMEVRLPHGPLKVLGDYTVALALHHDVMVEINVTVVNEA